MAMVVGCYYGNERDTATRELQYNTMQFANVTLPSRLCATLIPVLHVFMLGVTFCFITRQFEALSVFS